MNLREFYHGKSILITGHTGFKGSWLTLMATRLGSRVTGIALPPGSPDDLYRVCHVDRQCTSHLFDIADRNRVAEVVREVRPDLVFHLAAQPLVRQSYRDPAGTFQTNVMGTVNLAEAMRESGHRCAVVLITTDKVYENDEADRPFREEEPLGGFDPYSASKACAELVASAYRRSFFSGHGNPPQGIALATARAGNVIGGGDWAEDRLIPDIIRSIRAGTRLTLRNPASVRPWQFVLEPLSGYLLLGMKLYEDPGAFGEAWNFGPMPDEKVTVGEIAAESLRILGAGEFETPETGDEPHEAHTLRLDIGKAVSRLGWRPRLTTREAIEKTLGWYRVWLDGTLPVDDYSMKTIVDYFEKAGI